MGKNESAFRQAISSGMAFLPTRPGMFALGFLLAAIIVYTDMRADRQRASRDLEKREEMVAENIDRINEIGNLSQTELKSWVFELHEQNRMTREVQARLHKQELALAKAPVYLIGIVIALVLALAWIILHIHKEMNSIAANTIRNAISLTPPNLLKTFIAAQTEVKTMSTGKQFNNHSKKNIDTQPHRKRLR